MDNSCGLTGFFLTKAGHDRPIGHATAFTITDNGDSNTACFSCDYDGGSTPLIFENGEISRHCTAFVIKAPNSIIHDIRETFNHIAVIKRESHYRYGSPLKGFHDLDQDGRLIGNCLTIPMKIFEECGLPHFHDSFPDIFATPSPQDAIDRINRHINRDFQSLSIYQSEKTQLSRYQAGHYNALLINNLSGTYSLGELMQCDAYESLGYHNEGQVHETVPDFISPSYADQRRPAPLPQ